MDNYFSPLDIPEGSSGDFRIEHKIFKKGEKMDVVNARYALFNGIKMKSVIYDQVTRRHRLIQENQGVWMTDYPIEIYQHKDAIAGCYGDVLIGGLGIGYITKMLDRKKSVRGVTVVEKEQDVINLVWRHLNLKKSTIINKDLFKYLKENKTKFDCAYFDIWQGDGETIFIDTVLPLRFLARDHISGKMLCCNENVMRGQIKYGLELDVLMRRDEIVKIPIDKFESLRTDKFTKIKYAFWNWLRKIKPEENNAMRAAEDYAREYGTPEWENDWKIYDK